MALQSSCSLHRRRRRREHPTRGCLRWWRHRCLHLAASLASKSAGRPPSSLSRSPQLPPPLQERPVYFLASTARRHPVSELARQLSSIAN
ncbi:hypothetical protein HPP92_017073 [Vanilla planifolia]|uniref:Uncharacterized protein n=1 Tax=Vanilla planifolia TaxID=51239 RepID=A0A835QBP0_VANPL|nr:hypothetical protein HPP92_017073 [Vanilla planifolia]